MARFKAPRRPTKWTSSQRSGVITDSDSLTVASALALTTPTTAALNRPDPTVVAVRGQISVTRNVATANFHTVAWAILVQRVSASLGTQPIQVFNPFDTGDLERQDIMGMGYIEVPGVNVDSTDTATNTAASRVADIHIRVARKLDQNSNNLFFWISSTDVAPPGTADAFVARASFRTLLKW